MSLERKGRSGHLLVAGQNYRVAGGSDRYLMELADGLEDKGLAVAVFAAADARNAASVWSKYFPDGANFQSPKARDLLRFIYSTNAANSLQRLLREHRVALAHLNIYYGKLTASIFSPLKAHGIPVIQTLHEYKLICPAYTLVSNGSICEKCKVGSYWPGVLNKCNRGSISRSLLSVAESYVSAAFGAVTGVDHFIAVSEFARQKHIEGGVPPSKISTVHNFVRFETVKADSNVGRYVLYFGRLEKVKGVFTLLAAASRMRDVEFVFVGDGSAASGLAQQCRDLGLLNVSLRGHLAAGELDSVIRGALCTVLPSEWYEPFGLTLLESFARGRCVVASNIGGIPEVVTDQEDGFLYTPGSADELVARLSWLVRNPRVAAKMGAKGQRKLAALFSWDTYYQKLKAIYEKHDVYLPG